MGNTAFAINKTNSLLIYVNLLVGTFNFGNTYPETQIPFRRIQISLNSSRTSHNQTFATELNYFLS